MSERGSRVPELSRISSTTAISGKGQFQPTFTAERSSIQGVTPHSGTDIDGTLDDPSRPPPYRA